MRDSSSQMAPVNESQPQKQQSCRKDITMQHHYLDKYILHHLGRRKCAF